MLKVIVRGGARLSAISLRCGALRQPCARNLAQSAAAIQEPSAAADKTTILREERISRMEDYIRKYWAENGALPKAYILTKLFGGAKSIPGTVLSRLEPELKNASGPSKAGGAKSALKSSAKAAQAAKVPANAAPLSTNASKEAAAFPSSTAPVQSAASKVEVAVLQISSSKDNIEVESSVSKATSVRDEAKKTVEKTQEKDSIVSEQQKAQGKTDNATVSTEQPKAQGKVEPVEAKEPAVSLWQKLHNIAYGKTSQPSSSQQMPSPQARSSRGASSSALSSPAYDSTEEDDSESDSGSESDSDPAVNVAPESEDNRNPAQPLFRSDLQPRHGLFVKFLVPQAAESDLRGAFRSCGEIHRIQVVRSRNPGAKYIYGFVDFKTEEGLNAALKKEVVIRGSKVQTEPAKNAAVKEKPQKQESDSEDDSVKARELAVLKAKAEVAVPKSAEVSKVKRPDDSGLPAERRRCTLAVENIPHASLPQIIDALSQYGDVVNSQTKHSPGGNLTAFVEFKSEIEKDTALAACKVLLGGKSLRMTRIDIPLTTVVRLSNIPADASEKIASNYKSYGQVDRVDARMDGIVDIYYSASELNNMARILDKLNGLHVGRRKLRAMPAPISYPKTLAEIAETPQGLKWIESQRELVRKNMELSLAKAAMHSRDFQAFLTMVPETSSS